MGAAPGSAWLVSLSHIPSRLGSFRAFLWVSEQVLAAVCGLGSAHPIHCCLSHSPSAPFAAGANGPWYISRDWRGVPSRLDAAMAGRIYVASHQPRRRKSRRQRKRYNHHRSLNLGFWSWLQNDPDSAGVESDGLSGSTCEMLQSVYFFVGGESGLAGSGNDAGPGLLRHEEGFCLSVVSQGSGMQWEGAGSVGWQLPRAGDSPDSHVPFPQTSTTVSTCAPSAWTWCGRAIPAPSPSTGWTAPSPQRAPDGIPGATSSTASARQK